MLLHNPKFILKNQLSWVRNWIVSTCFNSLCTLQTREIISAEVRCQICEFQRFRESNLRFWIGLESRASAKYAASAMQPPVLLVLLPWWAQGRSEPSEPRNGRSHNGGIMAFWSPRKISTMFVDETTDFNIFLLSHNLLAFEAAQNQGPHSTYFFHWKQPVWEKCSDNCMHILCVNIDIYIYIYVCI